MQGSTLDLNNTVQADGMGEDLSEKKKTASQRIKPETRSMSLGLALLGEISV